MFGTLNPFRGLLPHSGVSPDNPLFAYYVRRVGWWVDWRSPRRYGLLLVTWMLLAVLVVGLVLAVLLIGLPASQGVMLSGTRLVSRLYQVFDLALIASLLAALVLDYVVMAVTLVTMVGGRDSRIDDLLHMTNLSAGDVVTAQHAVVRVQTWRLTAALVGVRLGLLLHFVLLRAVIAPGVREISIMQAWQLTTFPLLAAIEFVWLALVLGFLTLEPLWRWRLVTAVSVALSTRFKSVTAALVAGAFTVLLLMTVPQVVFIPRVFASLDAFFFTVNAPLAFVGFILLGVAIYFAYFSLENVALKRARQFTFREGRDVDMVQEHEPVQGL